MSTEAKISLGVIALFIFCGVLYGVFHKTSGVKNYPSRGSGIIAFGDSLVEGIGSKKGAGFVEPLSRLIGEPIKNYGHSGDTTAEGLLRLPSILAENPHPKIVLVLLGGNDYLQKVGVEQTFTNLRTIVANIQGTGAVVIVLGIRGGALGDKFEGHFDTLAHDMKVGYVSDVLSGLYGRSAYMSDTVHPNDAGYAKITGRVYPVLKSLLK